MKRLLVLVLAATVTPMAAAKVWVTVYQYDGKTPLAAVDANHPDVYRDIMVGMRLTLVISSDAAGKWGGDLELSQDDAPYGTLSGRGLTPPPPGVIDAYATYPGSCLDAAGTKATVQGWVDSYSIGLDLDNDARSYPTGRGHPAYPGDWFVVDYYAEQTGSCSIRLYAAGPVGPIISPSLPPVVGPSTLLQTLSFTHVPSRDFNGDTVVDFKDFARLAAHWRCPINPQSGPEAALDLKADGQVDLSDLASFCNYWLVRADNREPAVPSDPTIEP